MVGFLQTGRALYVLAAICLAGIFIRLRAGSIYKRLIRESENLALTKNKYLRGLKQNAEDTYRMNMGMSNTRVYLEHQMYGLKGGGMSLKAMESLAGQLTLLCFLFGGLAAFGAYWYREGNYEIVLYASAGILSGLMTMFVDYGTGLEEKRMQLLTAVQDYLENVMWPRMSREESAAQPDPEENEGGRREKQKLVRAIGNDRRGGLKRGADQTAASQDAALAREKQSGRPSESWLEDLSPDQKRMLGEMLKELL